MSIRTYAVTARAARGEEATSLDLAVDTVPNPNRVKICNVDVGSTASCHY
jgi:hypothetical protein